MALPGAFIATAEQREIHARIKLDRDTVSIQKGFVWNHVQAFRDYANGKHSVVLTDKQKQILRNLINERFCDNVCNQIVSEATGRINFLKWESKNEKVSEWLAKWRAVAKIQARQLDIHYKSLRDGNFALAVNWDAKNKRPQIYKEDWWNGIDGIYIHYGDDDSMEYAVKQWSYLTLKTVNGQLTQLHVSRRVIWFEDRVERWESINSAESDSWYPAPLDSDLDYNNNVVWPMPWVDSKGEPLGIPYVHFPNVGRTYGNYGVSELDGGVLGFQDQINDLQYNISMAGRMTGAQQYYATGVKQKMKPGTNDPEPIIVDAGVFHTSTNDKSQFGVLPAGDIDGLLSAYNLKLKRVAQMTGTPLHAITGGDWPSGDALLRAEMPAVGKAIKQINQYKDAWVSVATMAMKIHNVFSSEEKINYSIDEGIIEAVFEDPEKRDAVSRSIIVHNLAGVVSKREGLRLMGYSKERAEEIYEESVEEEEEAAEALSRQVVRGTIPGTGSSSGGKGAAGSGGNNKPGSRAEK